jgi:photosystem II stability/assembly factor-like uncharacterized protein
MTLLTRSSLMSVVLAVIIINSLTAQDLEKSVLKKEPYTWKNVQIVGGGLVDGIVFHPKAKDVCYCRTDMGGAYRRNPATKRWEPMLDWISYKDWNLVGVESLAVDPSDPNCVYLSCGTYTAPETPNGAILRSNDMGHTFQRTDVPFKMGGNENGRGNGERMAVDPNNGNILFLGTRNDGLWRSMDKGASWQRVSSFPDVNEVPPADAKDKNAFDNWKWNVKGSGINCVVFDPKSGLQGKGSKTIYVTVSLMGRMNFYCSKDGGASWNAVDGQPVQYRPTHAVLASDGNLYISYSDGAAPSRSKTGALWCYNTSNGKWKDISPAKQDSAKSDNFGYIAVAVDASNPKHIITSTYGKFHDTDDIYRTTDGGQTWAAVMHGGKAKFDYSNAPYVHHTPIHWMFDIEIDPFNPNHAMFVTGYGGWETLDLNNVSTSQPTNWSLFTPGIDETVPLDILSPSKGAQVISGIGDYCGFAHYNLDKPADDCFDNPHFGNTNSLACAEQNPELIVRVGRISYHSQGGSIGYSLDGGRTWNGTNPPTPESKLGIIAVSADGSSWVWTPENQQAYYTTDKGISWKIISNLPVNTKVIADKVNPKKFYAMSLFDGKLYTSTDGGATFTETPLVLPNGLPKYSKNRGDERGGQDRIYAAPGKEGDLWIAAFDGLYHSDDAGAHFVQITNVEEMHGFGFGKEAPGASYPALYFIGNTAGVRGIYRSIDMGKSWVRINDDQHQWGLLLLISGDPKTYGRVYVGTHGRGLMYGDPK